MKIITAVGFRTLILTVILLASAISPPDAAAAARLASAIVTQKVNKVTLAETASAPARAIATGAVVQDENVVRTGVQSRAELEFGDKTLARLGANTIFSFDVDASTLNFKEGSALFCKPKGTGPLQIRSAAVTAAITGSTGCISTFPSNKKPKKRGMQDEDVILLCMLEGSIKGKSSWTDENGKSHIFRFTLGAGEMLVVEPGSRPTIVTFDLARFVATSPLINGFTSTLPNMALIAREVTAFNSLVSRGFIDPGNMFIVNYNRNVMFASTGQPTTTRFDAGINQLTAINNLSNQSNNNPQAPSTPQITAPMLLASAPPSAPSGGFVDVGGSGIIRGQLIWQSTADLDLHLILPDNQQVFFGNRTATFNGGAATATLDADNLGGTINVQPDQRVENIVVRGTPASGLYSFFVRSFSTPNPSDPCTLLVTADGGRTTQTLNCNLMPRQDSAPLNVNVP